VLDVVVVRPRLVAWEPRGQRLGRLRPVDDRERDQRKSDDDGEPNEQTVALHRPSLVKSSGRGGDKTSLNPRTSRDPNQRAPRRAPFGSPSRFRFRPPAPLTFGFRLLPSLPASTYLRSVLGANGNLGEVRSIRKRSK
jgi:hypothetical protein